MSPHSLLFIDEVVLPEKGATLVTTQIDITMMTMFNALERTLPQWKTLLGEVGLKITEVYHYDLYGEDCIIEAKVAES